MTEPHLVPDYYPAFSCKMGACRRPCCEGWPISVSMKDYFRLLSLDCSAELRERLDRGLHLSLHPSEDAYAQILPRYDGVCPLHMADGRCALHAECGEDVLALVCRLYPRGMRGGEHRECSCANSCEAVLELLLHRDEPLSFITQPLEILLPDVPRQHHFNAAGNEQAIRLWLIRQLQRREYPLPQRMLLLGQALHAAEAALAQQDEGQLDALLSGKASIPAPTMPIPDPAQLLTGMEIMERMLDTLDQSSNSIRDHGDAALAYFRSADIPFAAYETASARMAEVLPQWETWFEHMLVNHMFFTQFPFQDRPVSLADEYRSLVVVYALLRCLLIGCLAEGGDEIHAVDIAAAVFRLVAHTTFDMYAPALLRESGCSDWAHIRLLLSL